MQRLNTNEPHELRVLDGHTKVAWEMKRKPIPVMGTEHLLTS
jgi:hypothetical protein